MEITVLKCDRCKREVEGLIEFSFINRNVQPEDNEKPEQDRGFFGLMYGKQKEYPAIRGGLCFNCTEEVLRWLGHQENVLNDRIKGIRL